MNPISFSSSRPPSILMMLLFVLKDFLQIVGKVESVTSVFVISAIFLVRNRAYLGINV